MSCLYEYAKRIARFPDETPYSSEIYLMKRLPDALYPYFPKEFDFKAPVVDFETTLDLFHLPFDREAWREYLPVEANEVRLYGLNELTWYQEGFVSDEDEQEDDFSDEGEEEERYSMPHSYRTNRFRRWN